MPLLSLANNYAMFCTATWERPAYAMSSTARACCTAVQVLVKITCSSAMVTVREEDMGAREMS